MRTFWSHSTWNETDTVVGLAGAAGAEEADADGLGAGAGSENVGPGWVAAYSAICACCWAVSVRTNPRSLHQASSFARSAPVAESTPAFHHASTRSSGSVGGSWPPKLLPRLEKSAESITWPWYGVSAKASTWLPSFAASV